jgi:endogenous inhibitor of DNA gyrase (YacG/DUF329 family)
MSERPIRPRKCAICGRPAEAAYSPFCSRRCAQLDLQRWLSGGYVVAGTPDENEAAAPRDDGED